MNRREFLSGGLAAATVAGLAPVTRLGEALAATQPRHENSSTVAVARKGTPEAMTRAVVSALGSMAAFVKRGDKVVVKPNIGWDRTPEQGANTNPEVVRTVVALCLEAGAASVKVVDRTCNDPRRCYKRSGIQDAVESLGDSRAAVEHIDERKFVELKLKDPQGSLTGWTFYRDLLEADKKINIPIAKHHNAARLTMSLKNIMGLLGGNRGNIHRDLDRNIAELNAVFRFDLIVLDAVRILTANGPQGGRLSDVRELNTIAASIDPVALDSFGATLFGLTAADVPHVGHAAALGLGEQDLAKVKMINALPG